MATAELCTVQTIFAAFLAETNGTEPEHIDPTSYVTDVAVNSVQMLQIHARLEDAFEMEIPAAALFDYDTVAALADYLAGRR
ncbi:MAG TPA: acyl carrier protein [Micromonosporaceae bacterium]|nr:acyl carrier protein [Micromonosporaceae bacterium]